MALPILNDKPKYEVNVPSLGTVVKFRPFLVKEEKILLLAMESQDPTQILSAIADTVLACITDPIDEKKLTTFDIEYLFLKIRSKAIGERAPLLFKCQNEECDHQTEITLNVDEITLDVVKPNYKIELTDKVSLKMKWPSYQNLSHDQKLLDEESQTEQAFGLVIQCIESILTEDESFLVKDTPREEVMAFLESLTSEQYGKISSFLETIPALAHTVEFDCEICTTHNKITLQGINDFF